MAYSGTSIPIPLGEVGLRTDAPSTSLPPNALIKANNVSMYSGKIEKSKGTTVYNPAALTDSVVAIFDWWPDSDNQRVIALTEDGKIWRDNGDRTFNGTTPIEDLATAISTDTHMVAGGQEESGAEKKLFILTGAAQVQIIEGDAAATRDINLPSPDWDTSDFPTFAIPYQGRMCMMGSTADPHRIYFSSVDDHENFVGTNFPNNRWELWAMRGGGDIDLTGTIQAGSDVNIFTTLSGEGFLAQGQLKFNEFTLNITQAFTGSPVFTYEYWNGTVFTALTVTTPADFSVTGLTTVSFNPPANWVVGDGTEGGNNNYYSIRVLASTAPATVVKANQLTVTNSTFSVSQPTFAIFPGEGDGILCAAVYRGLMFIFKRPFGVYVLDGRDPLSSNWQVSKYADSFGVESPHSVLQVLTDLIAANSSGSYTSLQASNAFGDFVAGDILANNLIENYIRSIFNNGGLQKSQCVYYPEKKVAYFTGQSSSADVRNQMLCMDVGRNVLRPSIDTKEKPNCISLRRDSGNVQRPFYGDENGFIWLMDQETYNKGGQPYLGEFQTAYTDFSFASPEMGGKNKIFDFLEVNYLATGNNDFFCDVFVDGSMRQTLSFTQKYGAVLDSFILDVDRLAGDPDGSRNRKPLKSCTGNKISFRFYNNLFNEAFKIERIIVSFRLSAEQVYASQT